MSAGRTKSGFRAFTSHRTPSGTHALYGHRAAAAEAHSQTGSFADVWLCWYTPADGSSKCKVAAKYVKAELVSNQLELQLFLREVNTLKHLNHRSIVQLIGVGAPTAQHIPRGSKEDSSPAAQDATSAAVTAVADGPFASCQQHRNPAPQNHQQVPLFLVQEYLAGGPLNRVVAADMIKSPWQRHGYTLADSLRWATQIAEALVYLHTQDPKVIHRDLKLSNILLTSTDYRTAEALVADFGLHTCVPQHNQQLLSLSSSQIMSSNTGTAQNSQDNSGHSQEQGPAPSWPVQNSHLGPKPSPHLHHAVAHDRHGGSLDPSYGSQFSVDEPGAPGTGNTSADCAGRSAAGSLVSSTAPPSVSGSAHEFLRAHSARLVYQRSVSNRRARFVAHRTFSVPRLRATLGSSNNSSSRSVMGTKISSGPSASQGDAAEPAEVQLDATAVLCGMISNSCRDALRHRGTFGHSFRQQYGQLLRAQVSYPSTVAESFREETTRDSITVGVKDTSHTAPDTTTTGDAAVVAAAAQVLVAKDPSQYEAAGAPLKSITSAPALLGLGGLRAALSNFSSISARNSSSTSQRVPSISSIASRVGSALGLRAAAGASTADGGPAPCAAVEAVSQLTARTGSLVYMAPEVFSGRSYNEKADVFSFGIMLYELLHYQLLQLSIGAVANDGQAALHLYAVSMAEEGFRPPINPKLPQEMQDLIKACWAEEPEKRPSSVVVLQKLMSLQQVLHLDVGVSAANKRRGSAALQARESSRGSSTPCCACLGS